MTTADRFPPRPAFAGAPPRRRAVPKGERLSPADRIQSAAVFYVAAWAISPPLFVNDMARLVAMGAFGLWLVCEVSRRSGIVFRPSPPVGIAALFLAYTATVSWMADGPGAVVSDIQTYLFVLFLIFFESARRQGLAKYRWVLWGGLLLLPLWMASTLHALGSNAHIARTLVRSSDESDQYLADGVGGYALVYAVLWTIPPLTYLLANLRGYYLWRTRAPGGGWALARQGLVVLNLLLAVGLVIKGGYSIATISLLLGGFSYLLLRGRPQHRTLRIFVASTFAAIALALSQTSLAASVLNGLEMITYGTPYHAKIEDARSSMETDMSVGSVYGRTERYVRSLNLFVENPLTGTLSSADIGKHSVVLDNFAQYGIFGGLAFLFILLAVPIRLIRASVERPWLSGTVFAFTVVMMTCTLFNAISASMGVVAFILFPLAMSYAPVQIGRSRLTAPPQAGSLRPTART